MRRKDREMPESFARMVLENCEWATLAMLTPEGLPYSVPLTIACNEQYIYFHAAKAGMKTDCLKAHPQVCLVAVGNTRRISDKFTTEFESAIAYGTAAEVTDDQEKREALRLLCERHTPGNMENFEHEVQRSISRTAVWKITVQQLTGKRKKFGSDGHELKFAEGWPSQDNQA